MKRLFERKPNSAIGLDVSTSAVKMLELRRTGKGYSVESYAAVPLQEDWVVDHQIKEIELVGEAIGKAVQRSRTKTKVASIALAGSQVISKKLTMPAGLSDDELEQQISIEAEHYIPFPLDEVNFDFEVLGPVDGDEGQSEVLLVASRTEQVEQCVGALEIGGLQPHVVDVEPYVMENCAELLRHQMPNNGDGVTVALVYIGAWATSAIVLHDMKAVYTRDLNFGGRQLTEEVMERYGLKFSEAGLAKKTGEGLPAAYREEVLQPFVADLVQVVSRALQLFYSSTPKYGRVDKVILAGGVATMDGVAEMVQSHLDVPCDVANPFQNMHISTHANPNALERDMPSLMIAVGLALRGLE